MSVSFHFIKSKLVFLGGREEAIWMAEYMPNDEVNCSYTKVYVDEENIRDAVASAKGDIAEGDAPKDLVEMHHGDAVEELKRVTRELPRELRKMLKDLPRDEQRPKAPPYFEIEIGW